VTEQQQMQRRIRRNALLLGFLALAFYVGYYLIQITRSAS
jgi:hypothetical protein